MQVRCFTFLFLIFLIFPKALVFVLHLCLLFLSSDDFVVWQTIVIVPVLPYGIIQLGSTQMVLLFPLYYF